MRRKVVYWEFFSVTEFFSMVFATLVDSIHRRMPRRLFQSKNLIDFVYRNSGKVKTTRASLEIELGTLRYSLRREGSDFSVFEQIVMCGELKRVIELAARLDRKHLRILDCGANIGLTTLVLKENFPEATIVCVEPERGNFAQLTKNIQLNNFSGVTALEIGVWYQNAKLSPNTTFRDGQDWSFALKADQSGTQKINVLSPQQIAEQVKWDGIDYLKIDIEGAEFDLLRNADAWQKILDTVKLISVEVHEDVGSIFEVIEILTKNGFKLERSGELLIGVRDN